MQTKRSAVSAILAVVIVVILVAAAGAGIYFLTMSGGSSTSTNTTTSTGVVSTTTTTSHSTTSGSTTSSQSTPSTTSTTTSASATTTTSTTPTQSTQTSTTYVCSTTYTTATSTTDYTDQYIGLIQKFSAMTFSISGNNNGTAENESLSYQVVSSNGGILDVNFTVSSASSEQIQAEVNANNNTVLSVTVSGYKITGPTAKAEFDAFMGLFGLEYTYGNLVPELTNSQYFHSTGTASETFGQTSFDVTTWVANTLPLSVDSCGYTSTLTDYTLKFGTPPGTSLTFITFLHIATSAPDVSDFTFQLVSITVA